jgi:hypothetical protein
MDSEGPVWSIVLKKVVYELFVGKPEDIIEVFTGIFRIAPYVRSSKHGHRAMLSEQIADGVG